MVTARGRGGAVCHSVPPPLSRGQGPELRAVYAVIGGEKEGAVDDGKLAGKCAIRAGVDVLNQRGPRRRAVAPPELLAMFVVSGLEEEGAVDSGETAEIRSRPSDARVDVLDQRGPL